MPVSREYLEDYLEEKNFVKDTSATYHGLLVVTDSGGTADTYGALLREKGWVVDFVAKDREIVHLVPYDGGDVDDD